MNTHGPTRACSVSVQARTAMRGSMPPAEYAKVQGNEVYFFLFNAGIVLN
jgi:hypothetical protein